MAENGPDVLMVRNVHNAHIIDVDEDGLKAYYQLLKLLLFVPHDKYIRIRYVKLVLPPQNKLVPSRVFFIEDDQEDPEFFIILVGEHVKHTFLVVMVNILDIFDLKLFVKV